MERRICHRKLTPRLTYLFGLSGIGKLNDHEPEHANPYCLFRDGFQKVLKESKISVVMTSIKYLPEDHI